MPPMDGRLSPPPPPPLAPSSHCAAFTRHLDAHFQSDRQRRSPSARTIVHFHPDEGMGDEMGGFLATLVVAMATGRRLEMARVDRSYLAAAFESPFDFSYTGAPDLLSIVPQATKSFEHMTHDGCVKSPPEDPTCATSWCCIGSGHYVPRPLDFTHMHNFQELTLPAATESSLDELLNHTGITYGRFSGAKVHNELLPKLWHSPARAFPKRVEFITGFAQGGSGYALFSAYFRDALRAAGLEAGADAEGCVVRHLLRPTREVSVLADRLRPSFWRIPASTAASSSSSHGRPDTPHTSSPHAHAHASHHTATTPPPRIAIHVRATAALIDRSLRSDAARYRVTINAVDAEMGCEIVMGYEGRFANVSSGVAVTPDLFEEYWQAAGLAEQEVKARRQTHATRQEARRNDSQSVLSAECGAERGGGKGAGVKSGEYVGEKQEGEGARGVWLLASDSMRLKILVSAEWQHTGVGGTTAITPSHNRCAKPPDANASALEVAADAVRHKRQLLEAVAELLLLAEADAIVHGNSRFAQMALLLCSACLVDVRVVIDPDSCARPASSRSPSNPLCVGEGRMYHVLSTPLAGSP